jgi:hypothetical protein
MTTVRVHFIGTNKQTHIDSYGGRYIEYGPIDSSELEEHDLSDGSTKGLHNLVWGLDKMKSGKDYLMEYIFL